MCISINLASDCRQPGGKPDSSVEIPIVVETLRYESANRKVLIAFDLVVRNRSSDPATLRLTHADNVEGRLATEDWFPAHESESDDRMRLMNRIYGPYWQVDREKRLLTYTDPIRSSLGTAGDNEPIQAHPLSFGTGGSPTGPDEVDPRWIDPAPDGYGTWRLKRLPKDDNPSGESFRPYSTFCLGPIRPDRCVFARITLVIRGKAYDHLVQPEPGGPFLVVSAPKVLRQIEYSGLADFVQEPEYGLYKEFFQERVKQELLEPRRYHVIIAQPTEEDRDFQAGNQLVKFRPASSAISELYIADDLARARALWFNAWSADFRLILQYEGQQRKPSRADFGRPLPQDVGA